jgi:diguanylate cyclase (GGDEF)-like protein
MTPVGPCHYFVRLWGDVVKNSRVTDDEPPNKTLRWNVIGVCLALAIAIGLVFLLDTGDFVDWIARHRGSKLDETIVVGVVFLAGLCTYFVRRWLGLSSRISTFSDTDDESAAVVDQAKRGLRRDAFGIGIALVVAGVLVFFFDTGWLVQWLAEHKSTKIDEIIVVSIVLLIGLCFFSVRRSIELTDHLQRYQELHEQTTLLNRRSTLMAELSDMLQSCLSSPEAYPIIASRAQVLLPGSAGALCVISNSRNLVEMVASWKSPSLKEPLFAPEDCWALRRGRVHASSSENSSLACAHVAQPQPRRTLCVPMMAHGETLGLLYVDSGQDSDNQSMFGKSGDSGEQLAKTLAEQAALALANLKLREALRTQSIRDPLTNLFNRRYMEESLDRELSRAIRKQTPLSVMLIDVDHFKRFNDAFGHEAGDTVLRSLGHLLQTQLRSEDIVCRYGGEEFVVILPDAPLDGARLRSEELRGKAKELVAELRGQMLGRITLSIGVATFPANGGTGAALVEAADAALYRAKKEGRDCVMIA